MTTLLRRDRMLRHLEDDTGLRVTNQSLAADGGVVARPHLRNDDVGELLMTDREGDRLRGVDREHRVRHGIPRGEIAHDAEALFTRQTRRCSTSPWHLLFLRVKLRGIADDHTPGGLNDDIRGRGGPMLSG